MEVLLNCNMVVVDHVKNADKEDKKRCREGTTVSDIDATRLPSSHLKGVRVSCTKGNRDLRTYHHRSSLYWDGKIWDSIPKPEAHKKIPLGEFFNFPLNAGQCGSQWLK